MFTHVHVRNFRGLSQLSIELAQVTVLIGPNSCGKTTVLQAVRLSCEAVEFARKEGDLKVERNGWISLYDDRSIRDDQPFLPTARWQELFLDAKREQPIVIELEFSADYDIERLKVELSQGRADALRMSVSLKAREGRALRALVDGAQGVRGMRAANLLSPIRTQVADLVPRVMFIPAFYGVVEQEEYRAAGSVRALLQSGQQGQVVRNLLRRLPNREGVNDFLDRSGLAAKLDSHQNDIDTERYLEVRFSDRNGALELSSAGTGLVSLLALFAAIETRSQLLTSKSGQAVIVLLDEPEAHLHPRLQGELASRLTTMFTSAGVQLLCATHSVEMINRFGRDERAAVLRIDRSRAGISRVLASEEERMRELDEWCDLSPFAKLNLLANRRIVFHEGPSDEAILKGCARLYLGKDPVRKKRFEDFTWAELSGCDNHSAKDVLKKALNPLFHKLQPGEQVRVVRLLDCDYSRTPQFESRPSPANPQEPYQELDVVWSRHSIESLFLEPECLTSWLDAALPSGSRPSAFDRAALLALVTQAIAEADKDAQLCREATKQLFPHLEKSTSKEEQIRAFDRADALVRSEPVRYQRGHDRAKFVLKKIRASLEAQEETRGLANKVRADIAQIVENSPLLPNLMLPPELIPPELVKVLDYMASEQ